MKSLLRIIAIGLMLSFGLASCEKEPVDDGKNYQQEFIGTWNVLEKTGLNAPQSYTVEITAGANENKIIIKGLYNRPDVVLNAELYGLTLDIPAQTADSISFVGSGKANVNFDQITIDFVANNGTGDDQVKAILTP